VQKPQDCAEGLNAIKSQDDRGRRLARERREVKQTQAAELGRLQRVDRAKKVYRDALDG